MNGTLLTRCDFHIDIVSTQSDLTEQNNWRLIDSYLLRTVTDTYHSEPSGVLITNATIALSYRARVAKEPPTSLHMQKMPTTIGSDMGSYPSMCHGFCLSNNDAIKMTKAAAG